MHKYNRSDKSSTTQGKALRTKAPGTALDLILLLSTLRKSETARWRKCEGDITPVSCVWYQHAEGAWRDHDCKPQCAHVGSYGENGLRLLLSVWIERRSTSVHLAWPWEDVKLYPDTTGWGWLGRSPVVHGKHIFYGCACLLRVQMFSLWGHNSVYEREKQVISINCVRGCVSMPDIKYVVQDNVWKSNHIW